MSDSITRLNAALEGRYRIERELGEGGMATVYLADDLRHERKVALKVLKPELAAVVGAERFLSEIKVTANLQHPHILPLFDSGEADGFLFYVMPYVEGESLRDWLEREKQLPVDEAVRIATAVANALDHAHRHDVIHRDIKPANILLQDGEPVVADFGIALAVGAAGSTRLTETGLSLGTPYYMSPEQATGDQRVGASTDTYALGSVLYEMLVGDPPYPGSTAQAVLGRIIAGKPVSATEQRPSIPANVDAAIRCALEKLPADRFTSAQDFVRALGDEHFRYGGDVADIAGASASPWNRLTIAMTTLAALLALTLGWSLLRPEPSKPVARFELMLEEMQRLQFDPLGVEIALSTDGTRLVYVGQTQTGDPQLFQRSLEVLEPVPISGTEGALTPAFSPDGEWVAFVDLEGLKTISFRGGPTSTVVDEGVDFFRGLDWGSDGMIYFVSGNVIHRVPATGGRSEIVTAADGTVHCWPDALPDRRGVLLSLCREGVEASTIGVVGPEGGEVRELFPGVMARYAASGIVYSTPDGTLMAVPFDLDRLETTGSPVVLVEGVQLWLFTSASQFALSETGTLLYLAARPSEGRRLILAGFDGVGDSVPLQPRDFLDPKWSPDGRRLAFQDGGNIYSYDMELGSTPRQLTFDGTNWFPVWSPDGTRVAFSSLREGTDGFDIFVKSVDDDTPDEMMLQLEKNQYTRQWLADDLIMFENGDGNGDLWWVDATGSGDAGPYLESEADLDDITVSPDGAWAAYQSIETGIEEIYVRSFPEPRQRIPVSDGGGQFPRWSPDGRTIYYWHAENAPVDTLYAARINTEPSFSVLSRQPVLVGTYLAESWDLHPEGDRIVAVEGGDSSRGRVILIQNWFEELKARVGN